MAQPALLPPERGDGARRGLQWESSDGEAVVFPCHAWRWGRDIVDEAATLGELRNVWAHQRALAAVGPRSKLPEEGDLLKRLGAARRRLEKLQSG